MHHTVSPAYFTKGAPPFVNDRGETLDATAQVDALAQAQSIGKRLVSQCIIGLPS
jgi:hypothetical protein